MATIFHITSAAEWTRARAAGSYAAASLQTEGFIHCSDEHQYRWVAKARFRGRTDLVLLHIDPALIGAEIRYENLESGSELFPHVYGPIPVEAVVKVTPLEDADPSRDSPHQGSV